MLDSIDLHLMKEGEFSTDSKHKQPKAAEKLMFTDQNPAAGSRRFPFVFVDIGKQYSDLVCLVDAMVALTCNRTAQCGFVERMASSAPRNLKSFCTTIQ